MYSLMVKAFTLPKTTPLKAHIQAVFSTTTTDDCRTGTAVCSAAASSSAFLRLLNIHWLLLLLVALWRTLVVTTLWRTLIVATLWGTLLVGLGVRN